MSHVLGGYKKGKKDTSSKLKCKWFKQLKCSSRYLTCTEDFWDLKSYWFPPNMQEINLKKKRKWTQLILIPALKTQLPEKRQVSNMCRCEGEEGVKIRFKTLRYKKKLWNNLDNVSVQENIHMRRKATRVPAVSKTQPKHCRAPPPLHLHQSLSPSEHPTQPHLWMPQKHTQAFKNYKCASFL